MDTAVSVELFVEILNRYVYYFDQQNDAVGCRLLRLYALLISVEGHNEVSERPDRTYSFQSLDIKC